jgi:hypothetical protein
MTSQIVNLKTIEEVFVLRKCYQCGGETLGPVVKHSVRDSMIIQCIVLGIMYQLTTKPGVNTTE